MRKTIKIETVVLCSMLVFFLYETAIAQQTIFNIPSSDVLEKGKAYFELDATFKTNNQEAAQRFSSFVPRVVFGIGSNVEVGLNVAGNINPGRDSTTLVPAIKWRFYNNEKKNIVGVIGDNLYVPIRNRSYKVGNYLYAQASKTFKTKTRITAGAYYFSKNVVAARASRVGGQFGFEQPVTSKFGIIADWYTGRHSTGYFTPGVTFKPHQKVTGYFGYSIGNTRASKGNHFFYAAVGINLN
jgi:hypothetical protein